jgi:hypothetical protein
MEPAMDPSLADGSNDIEMFALITNAEALGGKP